MKTLLQQAKDKRIWRVFIAYPSVTFVLLQGVEFFINHYGLDPRTLTVTLLAALVLLPAAILWNWRHGEAGQQSVVRSEVVFYLVSLLMAAALIGIYWSRSQPPLDAQQLLTAPDPVNYALPPRSDSVQSIAVLPFKNVGGDASDQYLSDGIAESLINWLSQQNDLRIASKSASFRQRENNDPLELARALGVESVISGNLERIGDQFVVSVSWVDARDDSQLWGEKLTQSGNDILAIEMALVDAIQAGLGQRLSRSSQEPLVLGGTHEPAAHEHYLRGHFLIQSTDPDTIYLGIDELRAAIAVDPGFARPYADIADGLSQLVSYGLVLDEGLKGEARTAAFTAVALAPELPEAHIAMAILQQYVFFDWAAADEAYEASIALTPSSPVPYHRYSDFLVLTLQLEKSRQMARQAMLIDPLDSSAMHAVGINAMARRQFDEGVEILGEWVKFYPQSRWAKVKYALLLSQQGNCARATEVTDTFTAQDYGNLTGLMASWLAWGHHLCGNEVDYALARRQVIKEGSKQNVTVDPGMIYLAAIEGDAAKVSESLIRVHATDNPFQLYTNVFRLPELGLNVASELERNEGYQNLLDELGFPKPDELFFSLNSNAGTAAE